MGLIGMSLSIFFRKLFISSGLQIKRAPKDLSNYKKTSRTSGHVLEIIGPSGVGKTFFYKKIRPSLEDEWFFRDEVKRYSDYRGGCFSLLKGKDEDFVEAILDKKYENFSIVKKSLHRKFSLHDFLLREMAADVYFRNSDLPRGLFSDEGVIHNFSKELIWYYDKCLSERDSEKIDLLKRFLKGRSIIHYDASTDLILDNLKRRSELNPRAGNDWIYHIGEEEVIKYVERAKKNKSETIGLLQKFHVPVLSLNAEDSFNNNKSKAIEFSVNILSSNQGES